VFPFRFTEKHAEILDEVTKNTGTGILKDTKFVKWIEGKGAKSKMKTLWCHGTRKCEPRASPVLGNLLKSVQLGLARQFVA